MTDREALDARTDRLARRLMLGHPVPRDTYFWARLRVRLAMHDMRKMVKREVVPAVHRLNAAMLAAGEATRRLAEAMRR